MSVSSINTAATGVGLAVDRSPRIEKPAAVLRPVPMLGSVSAAKPAPSAPPVDVAKAVGQIESYVRSSGRDLQFRVDDESGRVIVSVRDSETGELIRQIPNEEVLRIAEAIQRFDTATSPILIDDEV